jgi:hypothetical protein
MDYIDIDKVITSRALRLENAKDIVEVLGSGFILAGGALSSDKPPKDFDIFLPNGINLSQVSDSLNRRLSQWKVLSITQNAVTAEHYGQIIQFCSYGKETPEELIRSFDFSHCQAATVFDSNGSLERVVYTVRFATFANDGCTDYTGSEYPLASLMRCAKFISRGVITTPEIWKPMIMDIVTDIVSRGFEDEDDFSDQCSSISESFKDMNTDADELFFLLRRSKGGKE